MRLHELGPRRLFLAVLFGTLSLDLLLKDEAQATFPIGSAFTSPQQQIEGTWRLESVICADGSQGSLFYSVAIMDIHADSIALTLGQESCEVNLQGQLRFNDRVLTVEFNRGDWMSCSGALPTPAYVLNRFEFQVLRRRLSFIGNDLSPFASCQGKGGRLIF